MSAVAQDFQAIAAPQKGVLVLRGYGLKIALRGGHLIVEDGVGRQRRSGRFSRISPPLRRVFVIGHTGTVSLEAVRWLHGIGAALVQIDSDGRVLTTGGARTLDDVRVRRGQALALTNGVGLKVASDLLSIKINGQAELVDRMPGGGRVADALRNYCTDLKSARSVDGLRYIESRAAVAYWDAWAKVDVHFPQQDAKRIPEHWKTFGSRASVLTKGPRKAVNPANALLNYLYAILEAESGIAALAVGCDPGMGVIHADRMGRDSFACDLMEAVRPQVDRYVLQLLATKTFLRSDFFETREGVCRLMPSLSEALAQTASRWAKGIAPIAEHVAGAFAEEAAQKTGAMTLAREPKRVGAKRHRTPLTNSNRRNSTRTPDADLTYAHVARPSARTRMVPSRCRECGAQLDHSNRVYCSACLPKQAAVASQRATIVSQQRREAGIDGRSSESVRKKHSRNAKTQMAEIARWKASHETTPNPRAFRKELWPAIRYVAIDRIRAATGLSTAMCKNIRSGKSTPHARHWESIRQLALELSESGDLRRMLGVANLGPRTFAIEIEPHLSRLGVEGIRNATCLSVSYCRRILGGHHIPHRRHWPALLAAALGS